MANENMIQVAVKGADGTAKAIAADNYGVPFSQPTTLFSYDVINYIIVGIYEDSTQKWLYGVDGSNQLRKSITDGATWGSVLVTLADVPVCGVYTNGALLIWLNNGDLVRTTNDSAFTNVLTGIHPPRSSMGVAVSTKTKSKIMFCEYVPDQPSPLDLHVYYSSDTGATWTSVLTHTHPTDIKHYHTVDYFPGSDAEQEWIVTSGDGGNQVRWWRSLDDGATWAQVMGGYSGTSALDDQYFRTLGVAKIPGRIYLWAADTSANTYVMASRLKGLPTDGVMTDLVRRVAPLQAPCWGLKSDGRFVVAGTKCESATLRGEQLNEIVVSPDAGGTWFREYAFRGSDVGAGIESIQGPTYSGRYFVHCRGPVSQTIRLTPKKLAQAPIKAIDYARNQISYRRVLFSSVTPGATEATYIVEKLDRAVYQPCMLVKNTMNVGVVLSFRDRYGNQYRDNDTDLAETKPVGAGKTVMLQHGEQMMKTMIPAGAYIGIRAASTPASGSVTVTLMGEAMECVDHRGLI